MGLKAFCKRTGAIIYKNRANIEFVTGLGLVTAGTVLLVKDSEKIAEAFNEHAYRAQTLEEFDAAEAEDPGAGWNNVKERKDFIKNDIKCTVKDLSKTVVKDCAFVVGGEILQGVSHVSLNKQLANATVLAANISAAYANLKNRIVEDQGEEKLNEYLYGPVVKKVVVDEEGNVTETVEMVKDENGNINLPPHCFFFDESSPKFSKSRGINKDTVSNILLWLNQRLQVEGFLWENDIRRELGVELVECGWTSGIFAENPDGSKNELSFGFEYHDEHIQRFLDGYDPCCLIRLNVEDDIMSKMHLKKH